MTDEEWQEIQIELRKATAAYGRSQMRRVSPEERAADAAIDAEYRTEREARDFTRHAYEDSAGE